MSAIPNVPERVLNSQPPEQDNASKQVSKTNNRVEEEHEKDHTWINGARTEVPWLLHDQPVENQRPIKVIVIGCGYSGILCGIRIPERIRNCELVIYEKNAGIGGTWYENRYPGAACDIPSHAYQFSFDPKPDWSALYAPSWEIREYMQSIATKYSVGRFVRLQHEVVDCSWNAEEGKWHVKVKTPDDSIIEDSSDVVVSARGNLNSKAWPEIPGLWDFKGKVMHSAEWDEVYDFRNRRIGVIGSGSSAIQIVPKLQALQGSQLNCFIRNQTWISPPFAQETQDKYGMDGFQFSPEMIQKFKQDPQAWLDFRMEIEADSNNYHAITLRGNPVQIEAQKVFEKGMKERLKKKPHYYEWMKPGFSPGCRRLTPGPGFLEALVEDNVNYIRDPIKRIESNGVVTSDGVLHEIDVLVCATGFHASSAPPFPVSGLNGVRLKDHWRDRATNYLSLATDRFPNYFIMLGPNGAIGEGSLLSMIESAGRYIMKAIRKIQKENIRSMVVKPERVRDFCNYCDTYFKGTVYSEECRSWYKRDGQGRTSSFVSGLWPGSTLHCMEALRSPRWEDFLYEYCPEENDAAVNQMGWLGNGWGVTQLADQTRREDLAFYIMPEFLEKDFGVPNFPKPEENEHFRIRPWSY